ncbi:MAG: ABC transporter permease [Blautia sp.]|nr:ABC transporter permease [Blautia sp.]MCM1201506.1 ABC transporter permease [Bacteroides fragilis]
MKTLEIEFRKEKRTGILPLLPAVGILGAAYASASFLVRKDVLLSLPPAPVDILLTQVYGMIAVLNMFGLIVAACMSYHMEFRGNALKKMYLMPISVPAVYFCKFLILTFLFLAAAGFQDLALARIGITDLPQGTFDLKTFLSFAGYSFITSMPVLSFMILVSSRFPNLWVPLGIGVAGFLSGMALTMPDVSLFMLHPFVLMLRPAAAMNAQPDITVVIVSLSETAIFLFAGLWAAKNLRYE